jgi:hypothetical protein
MKQIKKSKPPVRDIVAMILFATLIFSVVYSFVRFLLAPDTIPEGAEFEKLKSDYLLMLTQCALGLVVMMIPTIITHRFKLIVPGVMCILYYVFLYCAIFLGEIFSFYYRFPIWDSILHAANGFLFAGFGFCLFSLFEKKRTVQTLPSPAYQSFTAFCFSMTVGVLWEIFEFGADFFLHTDMQKDSLRTALHTVLLPSSKGRVFHAENITKVEIWTADGASFVLPGYLDVGLADTMKDLAVNLWGALAFCIIGYVYLKRRRIALAARFIPRVREDV